MAPIRNASPSRSQRLPNFAPQTRTAFSRMVRNTGARSPRDELMTSSTFEVAACCSCSSRSSRLRWSSCRCRVGAWEPSSVLRCGRRLAVAGFLSRVPLRSPSTPPSRFNAAPRQKTVYFQAYCSMVSGGWELGRGPPRVLFDATNPRGLCAAHCARVVALLPHWEVANSWRVRLARAGRYRIVVDGGRISNTLFSLRLRSESNNRRAGWKSRRCHRVCPK